MSLDKATVANIARLARIKVPESDLESLAKELSRILDWIEQLNEVDTERVPPMAHVAAMKLKRRADEVTEGDRRDDVLPTPLMSGRAFSPCPRWSSEGDRVMTGLTGLTLAAAHCSSTALAK